MEIEELESLVIGCIKQNIEESNENVPEITPQTGVFTGIAGFDSLRAMEVLVSLEDKLAKELPSESVFVSHPPGSDRVCDIANAIKTIVDKGTS